METGMTELLLWLYVHKAIIRMFLRGYSVAMVTVYVRKNDPNLLNIGDLFDTTLKNTNKNVW